MNKNEKITPINIVSALEQAEAGLENMSKLMSGYYKSLIENGIPAEHAILLVVALQNNQIKGN